MVAVASQWAGVCLCAHHKERRHPVQICCQPKFNYDFICKIDDSYFQGLYEERRVASDSRLYAPETFVRAAQLFWIAPLLIHLWRHLQRNDVKTYVSTSGSLRRLPGLS